MFCSFQTSGNCSEGLWPQLADRVSILCSYTCPSAQHCWRGTGVREAKQGKSAGGLPIGRDRTGHSTASWPWRWISFLIPTFSHTLVEELAVEDEILLELVFSPGKTLWHVPLKSLWSFFFIFIRAVDSSAHQMLHQMCTSVPSKDHLAHFTLALHCEPWQILPDTRIIKVH